MIKDLARFILFAGLIPFTVFNITTAAHAGESKEGQNSAVKRFRDCVDVCPEMVMIPAGGIDKLTSSSGPTLPNAARFAPYLDRSAHTLLILELWIAPNSHFFVQK